MLLASDNMPRLSLSKSIYKFFSSSCIDNNGSEGHLEANGGDQQSEIHLPRNRRPTSSRIYASDRPLLSHSQLRRPLPPRRIQWRRFTSWPLLPNAAFWMNPERDESECWFCFDFLAFPSYQLWGKSYFWWVWLFLGSVISFVGFYEGMGPSGFRWFSH